jgi:hypothetical protein
LCHLSAFIGIKEDIIDVKRGSNKRLLVSLRYLNRSAWSIKLLNSPQALTNWAKIKVDLNLVVLKSNQRKSKSRVLAKPELKRNVKCCLRKSLSWGANRGRSSRSGTWSSNISD